MTIKTATAIERFMEENGYGSWFNTLFAIVKNRDAYRPELAVEPLCPQASSSDAENADSSSSSSVGIKENLEIHVNIQANPYKYFSILIKRLQ